MADHIKIAPAGKRLVIRVAGEVIGETDAAVMLSEGSYAPTAYVPRADIDMTRLIRTPRQTHCPHKGNASYFSVQTPAGTLENAVWSYETPHAPVAAIAGMLAFYPDKISVQPA
jgi:uncharacterized protein (DUF427 family)